MADDVLQTLGPQIKIANTLIEKELNKRMAALIQDYRLTGPQITLMVYLYETKDHTVTQKEVADKFVLSHPTIRGIVRRLAAAHLIRVAPLASDRRQMTLSLAPAGLTLLKQHLPAIYQVMDEIDQKIVGSLSQQQQQQLSQALSQVIQNF
ncbi:MarR family winged helix-turn-helix transcriptional regulator [Bombilactobacillus folatiphilus]|uniref:MarR family winged helix-turn-helix transcriptional regulator n=1 Tax=Bombilactobacillus folatiphilus TaxID=2923362 RepID=A0ABY4P8T3_9LACO|nr:MarR family winged helix-turn-helix transcriptional regulator [Bombilactobacillus folatiphilus]UQS82143.1 MarR family winged helix-turn-helix transcriptional regulator [Bombilactobacillus folatiphilus]